MKPAPHGHHYPRLVRNPHHESEDDETGEGNDNGGQSADPARLRHDLPVSLQGGGQQDRSLVPRGSGSVAASGLGLPGNLTPLDLESQRRGRPCVDHARGLIFLGKRVNRRLAKRKKRLS